LNLKNLGRPDLSAQVKFLAKFFHDLPRNFVYEKMSLMNSAFYWLLIQHVSTYGLVPTEF
jgi:hypothetical protein